jgi:hypothetical protein
LQPISSLQAEVAHLVEHDLVKVGVASSSLVFRSLILSRNSGIFFQNDSDLSGRSPGGEIGRHAGLKILFAAMQVTVQVRSGAQIKSRSLIDFFYLIKNFVHD